MKPNFRSLLALTVVIVIILTGCSAQEPPTFSITQPGNGNVLPTAHPVEITLSSRFSSGNFQYIRWEIYQDGMRVDFNNSESIDTREIHRALNGVTDGTHWIYARAQAYSGSNQSRWLETSEICYWVGDNPPSDFCNYQTIVQPSTASTATPIVTPIIIIRPDNSGSGRSNGSGGASGCAAYGDKSSCNLAGCSWTGSACQVTP